MRSLSLLWSIPVLFVACGGAQETKPVAPVVPVTPEVTPPPVAAQHAPTPPPPAGVEASSLDPSVSPCDDFFQYACGGWNKANPIPEDQGRWGRFSALGEQNEKALREILERDTSNTAKPSPDEPYEKALGDFYGSCIDEAAVEKDGLSAIGGMLHQIQTVSDGPALARMLARLEMADAEPFFGIGSEQDFKDATRVIGRIDQSGLGMPDRDYYLKDDEKTAAVRAKYVEHMERMFVLLGDKPEQAKAEATAVLALEKELAAAQISRVDHRNPQKVYHPMDRAALAKTAPAFPWEAYFKELGIPDAKAINVYEPEYLAAVSQHLAAAKKETWSDEIRPYLRWTLVRNLARALPPRFVDESFSFEKELSGAPKILPRWKRCVRAVDGAMGEALAVPFVKARLGEEGKAVTKDMVKSIEASMQSDLQSLPWMDDATRARAIDKVHKLFNKIGYPDKWRNYDKLGVERKSYATNAMHASQFETRRQLAKIGKPVERAEWDMSPPTVNAYYNPSLNEMVFPAGILQSPFYSKEAPQAVNFGGIGMVMGHELTHGFDDEGRQFDGEGNLTDWWTPAVGTEFDKRASCVADQYDGYVAVDDLHLNGKLTLGENIADLGGMKLALATLHGKGSATPETDRQFFMGIAQVWCGSMRPEMSRVRVRVDPHSPPKWRVNGPLSNLPEFATAFSCQPGDAMVRPPANHCEIW